MNLEVLKKAKKEKRMTLQEISDKSGIPKRTVDQIFSGKTTNPRIDRFRPCSLLVYTRKGALSSPFSEKIYK